MIKVTKDAIVTSPFDAVADAKDEWPEQSKSTEPKINIATAVYGLLGFLSSSDKSVTFSSKHDAGFIVDLAKAFLEANNINEDPDFDNYQPPKWEPQEQEWNGEGLPPVGYTHIQVERPIGWAQKEFTVVAHVEGLIDEDGEEWEAAILCSDRGIVNLFTDSELRPIQSTAERNHAELASLIESFSNLSAGIQANHILDWIENDMLKDSE